MALLEGAILVAEGAPQVLICYSDDLALSPYDGFPVEDASHHPFAVSLLLTPPSDAPLICRLAHSDIDASEAPEAALMRFLVDGAETSVIGVDQPWRLERRSAH
jgi:hypothetical protein